MGRTPCTVDEQEFENNVVIIVKSTDKKQKFTGNINIEKNGDYKDTIFNLTRRDNIEAIEAYMKKHKTADWHYIDDKRRY